MKNYYRIMLGRQSAHAVECVNGEFIGADFGIAEDLSDHLPDNWREFNRRYIPVFLENRPEKSRIAAGLACGALWSVARGLKRGDIVLSPDGAGNYYVGTVVGDYFYRPGEILPHRRLVSWSKTTIERSAMSEELRRSAGSLGTVGTLSRFSVEIEKLIGGPASRVVVTGDENVEDASIFALELHLEDFLVENWQRTELGKKYDIFEDEGQVKGRQYETDTGPIDILAISKDKKELLVVELKKGRASDSVVGQIQRYMGYVIEELADRNQKVRGVIIAFKDDLRIRRALKVASNIDFYRYEVSFKLMKV